MKLFVFALTLATSITSFGTVVIVGNGRGPTATREIATETGELVAGFGAFGVLDESGINGALTTFEGLNFRQFGLGAGPVSTSTAGQFSFQGDIGAGSADASVFLNQNIYLIVGFGGDSLATARELFVYKFNQTFGTLDSPTPITQILTAADAPGTVLLGTEVGNPATVASGRFHAVTLTLIPEPSTVLLGAIGSLAFFRRHRN